LTLLKLAVGEIKFFLNTCPLAKSNRRKISEISSAPPPFGTSGGVANSEGSEWVFRRLRRAKFGRSGLFRIRAGFKVGVVITVTGDEVKLFWGTLYKSPFK